MTETLVDTGHMVSGAVGRLHADLDDLAGVPVWAMGPVEAGRTLVALTRLVARVAALELRVAAQAEVAVTGAVSGATSTASWWAVQTRMTRSEAHGKVALATAVESRYSRVGQGMAAGSVLVDQARVIVRALDALPDDLDRGLLVEAEERLVADAAHHDARDLKVLGRRILEVLDPALGEAHEAAQVAAEEARAAQATRLTMTPDGHGKVHGRFTLGALQAAMLKKALLALAAPKHQAAQGESGGTGESGGGAGRRPSPERLGQAFAEYVERYDADRLPAAGGVAATVTVAMSLEQLTGGSERPATLDTGEVITAGLARRLACQAGIIPVVLGGPSQVLDLGRRTRFHTTSQRVALALRDGGCTAEGCDWPPGLCHAHHEVPWSQGGGTSVANGRLLCPRHHARAHDPAYTTTTLGGGKIGFTRRT